MINLCLVVIATQFSETKKRETERMMMERRRRSECSLVSSLGEPGSCYHELFKWVVVGCGIMVGCKVVVGCGVMVGCGVVVGCWFGIVVVIQRGGVVEVLV